MILSNSYREIMEHVEVTDEMRSRILTNISKQPGQRTQKRISFSRVRKYVSVAACVALLIVGGTLIQRMSSDSTQPGGEDVAIGVNIEECSSLEELQKKAGFAIADVQNIPFEVKEISYSWCWSEYAQITYNGIDNSLIYRKAIGEEDISGDYTDYKQIEYKKAGAADIVIKGNDDRYQLAVWQSDGYTCSIGLEHGITAEDLLRLVSSIQ